MADTPILELDRVSKRFDRTVVADDLCLGIEWGDDGMLNSREKTPGSEAGSPRG